MKKLVCILLLIQSGFVIAQTETVVTINGKKVQINPNSLNTADNGLSANAGNVQLGGALIRSTTLATSSVNTLAVTGLEQGATTDNIIVTDANGVLKKISSSSIANVKDVKIINTNYTVTDTDYTIIASQLSGDITITLPDASASKDRTLLINQTNVLNSSGTEVTVKFNVPVFYSDTYSVNEIAAPYYSSTGGTLKITLQSDGNKWYVVSSL
ncbi:hypothetical protein [Flavobacterium sp. LHD-85]|uniref:hypothetical protein n=1 Tax=Flavobacterium sp. LHD-85 TaxID=3071410 RepID=UPI0027E14924|nr:hypothetical protein [Flavobacterium sp. LHD-85]MDQ6531508.1 hypothetical protein [Flavobacterium sp. LHD-85]